jgi:hypothetical protein
MADIALGVIGVLGVVLDSATQTYGFISDIKDAPKAITTLGEHVKGLKLFVGPLLNLLSKPSIRSRPQNKDFLPSVEHAFSGFANILNSIDSEIKLYVKYTPGSAAPVWGGWLSRRRWKYAFKKSSILELEARLLGTIAALDLNLRPLDL